MLTGYNTDVSYGGETFHVQTEDKGLQSPMIVSLVYRAGTILAAKRTRYDNLIHDGSVDLDALGEILNKQHNLLVAAIRSGKSKRLEELSRKYSEQNHAHTDQAEGIDTATGFQHEEGLPDLSPPAYAPILVGEDLGAGFLSLPSVDPIDLSEGLELTPVTLAQLPEVPVEPSQPQPMAVPAHERLMIELLSSPRFEAGEEVSVKAAVMFGGLEPAGNAEVILQVIGTRIPTQRLSSRADGNGIVDFYLQLPEFSSGAAALVLSAREASGQRVEMKFMIRKH